MTTSLEHQLAREREPQALAYQDRFGWTGVAGLARRGPGLPSVTGLDRVEFDQVAGCGGDSFWRVGRRSGSAPRPAPQAVNSSQHTDRADRGEAPGAAGRWADSREQRRSPTLRGIQKKLPHPRRADRPSGAVAAKKVHAV